MSKLLTDSGLYEVIQQAKEYISSNSKIEIPKTETEFRNLSWSELKTLSDQCAKTDGSEYKHLIGYRKYINLDKNISGLINIYSFTTRLVDINYEYESIRGFTFFVEPDKDFSNYFGYNIIDKIAEYYQTSLYSTVMAAFQKLQEDAERLPNASDNQEVLDLLKNVSNVTIKENTPSKGVNSGTKVYFYSPSAYEILGSTTYGKDGYRQFEYFKNGGQSVRSFANPWWTRTVSNEGTGKWRSITTAGGATNNYGPSNKGTTSSLPYGPVTYPFCFAL